MASPGEQAQAATAAPVAWARRLPFYYGWLLVGAQFLAMMLAIGPWSFPLLAVAMEDDLGWSRSSLFAALTMRFLIGMVLFPFTNRLMDHRRWPRPLLVTTTIVFGATLMAVGRVQSLTEFYLIFGVLGGISSAGAGGQIFQALMPKWFVRKRGRATSFGSMGSAAAALASPLYVSLLIDLFGWRTAWVCLGVIMLLLVLPLSLLVHRSPEDIGLLPDGDQPELGGGDGVERPVQPAPRPRVRSGATEYNYTVRQALRQRTTWFLVLASVLIGPSTIGLGSSWYPHFTDNGISADTAAAVISTYGFFAIIGRIVWGIMADRYHIRPLLIALSVATGLPLLMLIYTDSAPLAFLHTAIMGLTLGGYVAISQLVWPNYFGRRNIGAIRSVFATLSMVSLGVGPYWIALLRDATGSYDAAFWIMLVGWMGAAALMFLARPLKSPVSEPSTVSATG